MTFWDFANNHPYVTIVLAILLFSIADSIGVDITRAIAASRLPRAGIERKKDDDE